MRFWQWYTTRWALLDPNAERGKRTWVKEKYLPFRGWTRE
jgi:hypothetical protein